MATSNIRWDGTTEDGRTTSIEWGSNPYTWDDVALLVEVTEVIDDGLGTGRRREQQDRLDKFLKDEKKKKRLIRLICRIKGEKVYDDVTEASNIEVKVEDVELVAKSVIGDIKLEIKSGV